MYSFTNCLEALERKEPWDEKNRHSGAMHMAPLIWYASVVFNMNQSGTWIHSKDSKENRQPPKKVQN